MTGRTIRTLGALPRELSVTIGIGQAAATAAGGGVSITIGRSIVEAAIRLDAALPAHLAVAIAITYYGGTMQGTHNRLVGGLESVGHGLGIGPLLAGHDDLLERQ